MINTWELLKVDAKNILITPCGGLDTMLSDNKLDEQDDFCHFNCLFF